MIRWLIALCVVLGTLCAIQWATLARLKADLAHADARAYGAALVDLQDRHEEFSRVMTWLDRSLRRDPALGRPGGLCQNGALDAEALGAWVFGVYWKARSNGFSEADARQRVLDAVRQPGQTRHSPSSALPPLPPRGPAPGP